jgi:hypothetical protein
VEDAYEKADSPPIALVVTEDGSNQLSVQIKERAPQPSNDLLLEATIPLDINVVKIEGLQATTHNEYIVLVEDGSDDEEEDPTVALVDDNPTLSQPPVDLLLEVMPPPDDDMHLLPTRTPSTTITRRRRKSYDRSSFRRSARLAQCNSLRNLGIITKDGKFDQDAIQHYADFLKELVSPDHLSSVMRAKGHTFSDLVARISLPLR